MKRGMISSPQLYELVAKAIIVSEITTATAAETISGRPRRQRRNAPNTIPAWIGSNKEAKTNASVVITAASLLKWRHVDHNTIRIIINYNATSK
jgi:hypothetical protein